MMSGISRKMFVGILIGVVAILVAGSLFFVADTYYKKALDLPDFLVDKKIQYGETASHLNPLRSEYKSFLALAYMLRAQDELRKPRSEQRSDVFQDTLNQALAYAKRATELSPRDARSWEALGYVYASLVGVPGAVDLALKAYERSRELSPRDSSILLALGKLELEKSNIDKAQELFDKAFALDPESQDALFQLAMLDKKRGNTNSAILRLEELVQNYPSDMKIVLELGLLYANTDKLAKATEAFQRVLQYNPLHSDAHFALGVVYEKQRKKQQALEEFQKVLELNPGNEHVIQKIQLLQ